MVQTKDKCPHEVLERLCSDATRSVVHRAEAQQYCLLNGTKHAL